ncbi:hypothetical protein Tco_1366596 [Tanacetum coccineum]
MEAKSLKLLYLSRTNVLEVLDRLVVEWESCRRTFLRVVSCNGVVVSGVPAKVGAIKCVDRVAGVIRNTGLELSYLYGLGRRKNFSAPYIVKELNVKDATECKFSHVGYALGNPFSVNLRF